jgi:sulfopyruvate decarboxylase TPP-binding subunit
MIICKIYTYDDIEKHHAILMNQNSPLCNDITHLDKVDNGYKFPCTMVNWDMMENHKKS